MKITRQRLMELANITESPRTMNFIYSAGIKLPVRLDTYDNQQGPNSAVNKALAQHFPGVDRKDMLVFAAKDTLEADKIKTAQSKSGVIGFWADPTTLLVHGKQP